MRYFSFLAILGFVMFCSSGCTVIKEYPAAESSVKVNPQEYELGRKLVSALVKNDGKAFVALLPEETRSKYTVESLEKTRKSIVESLGEPVAFSFFTALELPALTPQIWKIRFCRTNLKSGEKFYSEVLFRVITGMFDKKQAVITGFQFI